jgi:hypothetical protein
MSIHVEIRQLHALHIAADGEESCCRQGAIAIIDKDANCVEVPVTHYNIRFAIAIEIADRRDLSLSKAAKKEE